MVGIAMPWPGGFWAFQVQAFGFVCGSSRTGRSLFWFSWAGSSAAPVFQEIIAFSSLPAQEPDGGIKKLVRRVFWPISSPALLLY